MAKSPLRMSFMKTILMSLLLLSFMPLAAHASKIDMTGKWTMQVKSGTSSGTPVFDLKQEGQALSGSYTGRYGEAPVTGKVTGSDFEITYNLGGVTVVYAGKVKDNTCEGNVDFGGYGKATFTGQK